MAEHKTRPTDAQSGTYEKKDTNQPMDYSEAKAKGHANQEQKGHAHENSKGERDH